jgi:hypothetical protein
MSTNSNVLKVGEQPRGKRKAKQRKRSIWFTKKQMWQVLHQAQVPKEKINKKLNSVLMNIWKALKPAEKFIKASMIKEQKFKPAPGVDNYPSRPFSPMKGYVRSGNCLPIQSLSKQRGVADRETTVPTQNKFDPRNQPEQQGRGKEGNYSSLALGRAAQHEPAPASSLWVGK